MTRIITDHCHAVTSFHSNQTMTCRRKSSSHAQPGTSGKIFAFQLSSRRTWKKSVQNHYFSVFWKLKIHLISLRDNPAAVPCSDTIMERKKTRMNLEPSLGLALYHYFVSAYPIQAHLHDVISVPWLYWLGLVFWSFAVFSEEFLKLSGLEIPSGCKNITILKFTLATRAWAENDV